AGEQSESIAQTGPHCLRRQELRPGGRQLNREWKAVEPGAQLLDRLETDLTGVEVWANCVCPLDKQGHTVGRCQGLEGEFVLAGETEAGSARGRDADSGTGSEQLGQMRSHCN